MKSFIPPKLNLPVLWITDFSLPILLKTIHNIDAVEISPKDRTLLKSLKDERLILVSNHPTTKEPPIVYSLANTMGSRFHYMASREVFDWGNGFVGGFIQSIGAYSIIAGTSDKESLKATREILSSKGGKLALFPEGEPTSGLNDSLLPFQSGIAQLGFWGLEDAIKEDLNSSVLILPCFIKYKMNLPLYSIQKDMDRSLDVLENRIGISKSGKTIIDRFQSIGLKLIEKEEREYGIIPEPEHDYNFRLGKLRHTILDNVAAKIEIPKYDKNDNAILKLRKILSYLESVNLGISKNIPPNKEVSKWARITSQRAYDSISLNIDYLLEFPSPERLYEWLYRFETEILGNTKNRPHNARVTFAKPINLRDEYNSYKIDKKNKVMEITNRLKETIEILMKKEIEQSDILFPIGHKF